MVTDHASRPSKILFDGLDFFPSFGRLRFLPRSLLFLSPLFLIVIWDSRDVRSGTTWPYLTCTQVFCHCRFNLVSVNLKVPLQLALPKRPLKEKGCVINLPFYFLSLKVKAENDFPVRKQQKIRVLCHQLSFLLESQKGNPNYSYQSLSWTQVSWDKC